MRSRDIGLFVGRAAELSVLDGCVAGLVERRGGVVWIEGVPGVGKSALVAAMAERAAGWGCEVLRGVADELMEGFPLRVMADCLGVSSRSSDAARVELAGLLRGAGSTSGVGDAVYAAGELMVELVDRLCARGPVVLVVEDLQWADEASVRLWNRLARMVDQIALLVVGVVRGVPEQGRVWRLRELVVDRSGVVVELGPLGEAEVLEIARRLTGGVPGPRLRVELARAGGNPLYVRELVDALIGDGLVVTEDGVAELRGDAGAVPGSLALAIGRRLGFLSDRAREMLRTAALLGTEFDARQLAVATGLPSEQLVAAVREAVAGGVLDDGGNRLVFRHVLIQQVLARQVPSSMAGMVHRQIARALAAAGSGVGAVARHVLADESVLDEWVVAWLAGVDVAKMMSAPQVAVRLLERAVPLAGDGASGLVLRAKLMRVLYALGQDDRVVEVFGDTRWAGVDEDVAASALTYSVRSMIRVRRWEEGLAAARQAVRDPELSLKWRSRLEACSAIALADLGRGRESRETAARALADAERCGDAFSLGHACHASSFAAVGERALEYSERGIAALGTDSEEMELRALMITNRLDLLAGLGRDWRAELPGALVLAERTSPYRVNSLLDEAAEWHYMYGDWDEALLHVEGIEPDFLAGRDNLRACGVGAMIGLHRNDRALAAGYFEIIDEVLAKPGRLRNGGPVIEALSVRAEYEGDMAGALELAATFLDTAGTVYRGNRITIHAFSRLLYIPAVVRLALALGDRDTASAAVEFAEAEENLPENSGLVWQPGVAGVCRAMLDDDVDALNGLAELCRERGLRRHLGFVLVEVAARQAAQGAAEAARATLTEAARANALLGAEWDIRRADARLRGLGVHRGSRGVRRREQTGWDALTLAELKIARLVGQGRSNTDIAAELLISRRTVQTHVSHILGKLHARSRTEIAQAAAEHEGTARS